MPAARTSAPRRPAPRGKPRSRTRKAGESAYGALLWARMAALGLLALLLVAAGVRTSWHAAPHAMFADGRERGTMRLLACGEDACTGPFAAADGQGTHRQSVTLRQPLGREPGESLSVALRPGTDEAVRTGAAGVLYAWLPLAGSLLLAAPVIAAGPRMVRTAWATAGLGLALLVATFAVW